MTAPSVSFQFVANTTANGPDVSQNFTDLLNYMANRNDGSATWDRCLVTSGSAVPLIANNSTGTSNIANFQDNGSNVFQIVDGGDVYMNSTKKLFLDGGGDTYLTETAANILDFSVGGTTYFRITNVNTLAQVTNGHFAVPSGKKCFLDGGSNTYLIEAAGDVIDFYAGDTAYLRVAGTTGRVQVFNGDFSVSPTKKIYFDDASDTYITQSNPDVLDLATGGTVAIRITDSQILDYRTTAITPGVGADATLGATGGSGPGTATMNSWVKIKVSGIDVFIPVWR